MSRGLRNNNPGNIRQNSDNFLGEIKPSTDPAFKQFESIEYGYRAIFVTLNTYQKKYGLSTIRAMISRWAPPKDNNDTEAYIRAVSSESGVPENSRITSTNKDVMIPIVAAMSRVENGGEANIADVQRGWDLFMQ